jgi:hypothetical protein
VTGGRLSRKHSPGGLRNHGLSIALVLLFVAFMAGQTLTGLRQYNHEQQEQGRAEISLPQYFGTGHFLEATGENWESEFLQMAAYVLLTASLFQKGSSESKKLDELEPVDRDPRHARKRADAPWPVRRGGWVLRVYEHSLSIAFVLLFGVSFVMHAVGGAATYNDDLQSRGEAAVSTLQYMGTSRFWFESFQNWQSEFLSLVAMVLLSIWLRERGSPESKPVDAAHASTGSE